MIENNEIENDEVNRYAMNYKNNDLDAFEALHKD